MDVIYNTHIISEHIGKDSLGFKIRRVSGSIRLDQPMPNGGIGYSVKGYSLYQTFLRLRITQNSGWNYGKIFQKVKTMTHGVWGGTDKSNVYTAY